VPRLGFLLRVDEIIDVTLSRRKDLSFGISTLFAAWMATARPTTGRNEIALSDIEFDKSVKLDFEREMLGTYISDHPLYEIESTLAERTDGSIISIRERGDDLARANKVSPSGGFWLKSRFAPPRLASNTLALS